MKQRLSLFILLIGLLSALQAQAQQVSGKVTDLQSGESLTDIGLEIGCYSMDQIPAKYKAWGSGNFAFQITGQTLKLTGVGAHMGLYKVGDAGGAVSPPATSVTYKIMELAEDKLVIEKRYDWGGWTFTFVPKR